MKRGLLIIIFCSLTWLLKAQVFQVGYYGHYGIDPGVKIGAQLRIAGETKGHQLYTSPQLGYFNQRQGYQSIVINNDIGYLHRKNAGGFYKAISGGLAYIMEFNTASYSTSVGDGSSSSNTNINHMFMTTINLEIGGRIVNDFGWYTKGSFGGKVPRNNNLEMVVLFELGLNYSLN